MNDSPYYDGPSLKDHVINEAPESTTTEYVCKVDRDSLITPEELMEIVKKGQELFGNKPKVSARQTAAPEFTFTLVNNKTHETIIEGYCNGWQINNTELGDSIELPDVLITIAPKGPPGMEDKDTGIPWEELGVTE